MLLLFLLLLLLWAPCRLRRPTATARLLLPLVLLLLLPFFPALKLLLLLRPGRQTAATCPCSPSCRDAAALPRHRC
jgi:hypothetical protein